jgi:hypothetical protein
MRVYHNLGGNGNGGNNFVATTIVASLHSLISVAQKKERKNDKQRGTNINKEKIITIGGLQKT